MLDRRTAEEKAALAFLAGAGFDSRPMLRVEANGGYFDRGNNELVDVNDQKVQLFGASAQIALHKGMPVQSSIDYKLYKNNGERISGLFNPVNYPGGLSWLAMAEFTVIGQTLKDPDETGTTSAEGLRRRPQRARDDGSLAHPLRRQLPRPRVHPAHAAEPADRTRTSRRTTRSRRICSPRSASTRTGTTS